MATTEEVKKLAELARIRIDDSQLEKFTRECDAILAYVEANSNAEMSQSEALRRGPVLRNVTRKDEKPNTPGANTKKIVEQFPASENNALVVKQIISHEES